MLAETDEDEARRQLAELVGRLGGRVTARELRGHGFGNDADAAEESLNDLAKHGYGRWEATTPSPKGGRPKAVFVLND